jgi:hypothetical protein
MAQGISQLLNPQPPQKIPALFGTKKRQIPLKYPRGFCSEQGVQTNDRAKYREISGYILRRKHYTPFDFSCFHTFVLQEVHCKI